ncbi:uncharacterized protein LOC121377229 [Gigantopelta aegis]|uniref:uncharacterized protein LOC121377229 n=1 Tax=Gigantopelta aegis TaxID=1735272 RepID=UPI001B889F71|nr:uncharacterized protein LOC121377229 [Gigantopelta aegis]
MKEIAVLIFSLQLLMPSHSKIGFIKDQKENLVFPPKVTKIKGLPDGHLGPLGAQCPPTGPVEELEGFPNIRVFYNGYAKTGQPVVFRQALEGASVLTRWSEDEYLNNNFGKMNVSVTMRRQLFRQEKVIRNVQVMQLKKFLYEYMYEDWYLSSTIPAQIMAELPLPPILSCGTLSQYLQEAELWMSSGGTSSKLHSHLDHNLHCVLFGRRDFVVIENKYKRNFDFQEAFPNAGEGSSPMDMDVINAYRYNKLSATPWTWSTLRQGDCILIPAGYLHHVRAIGRSISFTVLFTPLEDIDFSDCKQTEEKEKPLTLADANFTWAFKNGVRHLSDKKLNAESMRHHLISVIRDKAKIHFKRFEKFYNESMAISKNPRPAWGVFQILKAKLSAVEDYGDDEEEDEDEGFDEYSRKRRHDVGEYELSRAQISMMSNEQLQRVADIFNEAHQPESKLPERDEL